MIEFGDDYRARRSWEVEGDKVYAGASLLRGADASTFEVLNYMYARDASRVYYPFGVLAEADPASFRALDSGASFSDFGISLLNFESYASDKNNVYHYAYTIGKPSVVRLADPPSFRSLNGKFGRDEKSAFIGHRQIKGAQVKSWTLLQGLYSCDDDFCFYGNKRIVGARRESFICLPSFGGLWAKDKYHYYDCGRVSSADEYLLWFDEMVKGFGVLRESLVGGRL